MLRCFTSAILAALSLALLAWSPSHALAAPKTIAIVNLSSGAAGEEAAAEVRLMLNQIEELRPTTPGDLARALEDALPQGGPEGPVLAAASAALQASAQAFNGFKSRQARSELDKARRLLFSLAPSKKTNALLADLSFRLALIHLRQQNRGLGTGELELLHRLDPDREIDPVRYPPNIVQAFKGARAGIGAAKNAKLSISATYDGAPVFIDGAPAGVTPLTVDVAPGVHIVAIAGAQYQAAAQKIEIDPNSARPVRFDLKPRSTIVRALELRFAAVEQGLRDEDLRAAAAAASRLVGSDSVLVIMDSDKAPTGTKRNQVRAALYIQHLDRLSFRRKVDHKLTNMLALHVGVGRPAILQGPRVRPNVPWYRSNIGIGAIGGGLAVGLATIFAVTTGTDSKPDRRGEPDFFPL